MTAAVANDWYPDRVSSHERSGKVFQFPPAQRVTLSDPQLEWVEPVINRLNEICGLQVGWDGYRGCPTRFDVARFSFNLLQSICTPDTPAPSIVPLSSGGLQIEWSTEEAEIELTVYAPYSVHAWGTSPSLEGPLEEPLTTDYSLIIPLVQKLG
jgi:hypothetical protein